MDYSSLFSSGFRAISSRHRRSSSTMEPLSPTSPNFSTLPWPQRHDRALSLAISPQKRRPSDQQRSTSGANKEDAQNSSITDLARSGWDSPTLPNFPASFYPYDEAEGELPSPSEKYTAGFYAPSSPVTPSHGSPLYPMNGPVHRPKRNGSIGESFLSFAPSPAENKTHAYPNHRHTVVITPRTHTRRHTVIHAHRGDRRGWINGPLPPIPSSPVREGRAVGADESKEDWRSLIDELLENETSMTL